MYLIYSLSFTVGFIALLPRFIYQAWRGGKYLENLLERLGYVGVEPADGAPTAWVHCVSVGETQAARPVVRALRDEFPAWRFVVSTTTITGQRLAREVFEGEAAQVFYFPFDWASSVRRALRRVGPRAVLIMETELWPRFLRECAARNVPVALVNGRISERSFRRYNLVRCFFRRVVNQLALAAMQTECDAQRIRALGIGAGRAAVSGNVKFDVRLEDEPAEFTGELRSRFGFGDDRPLIVAASTHAPEERLLLEAWGRLLSDGSALRPRLLIAPRHPERFGDVESLLRSASSNWVRRSDLPRSNDSKCDVVLLDTIGELRAVYPLAAIVFVGGSIAPAGGHNVLEPAAAGACILTGPHTSNFAAIIRSFLEQDALVQLPDVSDDAQPREIAAILTGLLADADRRRAMGSRALAVLEENRGATSRTVRLLRPLLSSSS